MEKVENAFWASCNLGYGPATDHSGSHFGISISLEANASETFGGVRLVIMCRRDAYIQIIRDCPGFDSQTRPQCLQIMSGLKPTITHRDMLKALRESHGGTAQKDRKWDLPMCTILLEMIFAPNGRIASLRLTPSNDNSHTSDTRIPYNSEWVSRTDHSSLVAWLQMTGQFGGLRVDPDHDNYDVLPVCFIKVIPLRQPRPPMADLPPNTIKLIVVYILAPRWEKDWKRKVLEYALLRKSWLPALDIFWKTSGRLTEVRRIGNPILMARSLKKQPERGRLISCFFDNCSAIYKANPKVDVVQLLGACREIVLSAAPSLTRLELGSGTLPTLIDVLPHLKSLKIMTLFYSGLRDLVFSDERDWIEVANAESANVVSIERITEACSGLGYLRKIIIEGEGFTSQEELRNRFNTRFGTGTLTQRIVPNRQDLEYLLLRTTRLPRSCLISLSSQVLSRLDLRNIFQISNVDLEDFLDCVSATLEVLRITECDITQAEGDLNAAEKVLPRMDKIREMTLLGEYNLSVGIVSGRGNSEVESCRESHFELAIFNSNRVFSVADLPAALEITGWTHISLSGDTLDHRGLQAVDTVAGQRGIHISYYSDLYDIVAT